MSATGDVVLANAEVLFDFLVRDGEVGSLALLRI
jgi:hypothetical protein